MAWWALAAAGVELVNSWQNAEAAKKAGTENRKNNLEAAARERHRTALEERRQRAVSEQTIGGIRAAYGASGVSMDGSALAVLENSIANAELDAQIIRLGGEARARGYENNARLDGMRGNNEARQEYLGAAASLLSATGEYYENRSTDKPKNGGG